MASGHSLPRRSRVSAGSLRIARSRARRYASRRSASCSGDSGVQGTGAVAALASTMKLELRALMKLTSNPFAASARTIADLSNAGFPKNLLPHLILMDFGAAESAFDGMIPLGFFRASPREGSSVDPWGPSFPEDVACVDGTRPVLYFRCNGGHYFTGSAHCPLDGWCVEGVPEAQARFADAISCGELLRPNRIVSDLVRDELQPRVVVAQFGDPRRAVRGIAPMIYHHEGQTYLERDSPLSFG